MNPRETRGVADAIDMLDRGHPGAALLILRRLLTEQFELMRTNTGDTEPGGGQ